MPQANENPFEEFLTRYYSAPALFVEEVLGNKPDPWQRELLNAVAQGHRRLSVASGHGCGKSTAASWLMLHYLLTRYPSKIVVTAPTTNQLYDALMAELKSWIKQCPQMLQDLLEVKAERVELKASPTDAFVSARVSRAETPESLAGVHSKNVLLVADEASGIPDSIFQAAAGSMSGHSATTLLLGNPLRSSGFFYDTHHKLRSDWFCMRVDCHDSPRVSKEFIAEMAARFGERSNQFRVRVQGLFPLADDDVVIGMELIEAAVSRDVAPTTKQPISWGFDVARFGADASALCKRQGNTVLEPVKTWRNLDLMELTGRLVAEYESIEDPEQRPTEILIDAIGLGSGVVDRAQELGLPVRGINVSEAPSMSGTYRNLRAELWYRARDWFSKRDCHLPNDIELINELAMVRYKFTSNGKLQIESKDEIKKRAAGRSPDLADAFVLTFAGSAVTAQSGASNISWNKPLRRNIPRISLRK